MHRGTGSTAPREPAPAYPARVPMSNRLIEAHFRRELARLGYGGTDPQWRLSYCQGDGMAYYGKVHGDDLATLARRHLSGTDLAAFTRAQRKDPDSLAIRIRDRNGRYHHYASMAVEWDEYSDVENEALYTAIERAALQRLFSWVVSEVPTISARLEKEGYAIHEAGSPFWILGDRDVEVSRWGRERGVLRRYRVGRFEVTVALLDDPELDPEVLLDGWLEDFAAGRRVFVSVQVFVSDVVGCGTWGRALERGIVDTPDLGRVRRVARELYRRAKSQARTRLRRLAAA